MIATLIAASVLAPPVMPMDGYVIGYDKLGSGPPMAMVPGGPGFSGEVLRSLADEHKSEATCILFDQYGMGRSHSTSGDDDVKLMSLKQSVKDLDALRAHLGYEKWTVFGQSWGTFVALEYAATYPTRVEGLILASNPPPNETWREVLNANLTVKMAGVPEPNLRDSEPFEEYTIMVYHLLPYYFYDVEKGKKLVADVPRNLFSGLAFLFTTPDEGEIDFANWGRKLKSWSGSPLIIQGHQDVTGSAAALQVAALFRRPQVVLINKAGHFPWMEDQGEFNSAMSAYLKRRS